MSLTLAEAKKRIDRILSTYAASTTSVSLLSDSLTAGKVYEAWVLSVVLERLRDDEGYNVQLVNGTQVHLKSSPGPINASYPHFLLRAPGRSSLDVWTDVEFATLSHKRRGEPGPPSSAFRHELDICVVPRGTSGYPSHDAVLLGVECKNTSFEKVMARAALGVRRELSLLCHPRATHFDRWPRALVPADPPSVLMVYATDPKVTTYQEAGEVFGVGFYHEPML
ncbi:hypothetical protein ACFUMH_01750 [Cellulomonas sp. NPDC057328]|uniref:hypothetical protein n=1 Tax=Cellulomonas sp. NPDC057328 TaxID=3346101 RepID=UPI0036334C89